MKKRMILAIVGVAMSMSVHAQVQFSKFDSIGESIPL